MNVKEAIQKRRSIRKFRTEPIPDEIIYEILEAGRLAPSSTNLQPWRYIIVKDKETKKKLCQASYGQKFIEQAPLIIVCCGDLNALKSRNKKIRELIEIGAINKDTGGNLLGVYRMYRKQNEMAKKMTVMANCMISIEHIILQATELDLGSCWVRFFKEDGIKEILDIPEHLIIAALVPIGYSAESPAPRPRHKIEEIVFWGKYGESLN